MQEKRLEKRIENQAPSSRLPNNMEASSRQHDEEENSGNETKSQTFVFMVEDHDM